MLRSSLYARVYAKHKINLTWPYHTNILSICCPTLFVNATLAKTNEYLP